MVIIDFALVSLSSLICTLCVFQELLDRSMEQVRRSLEQLEDTTVNEKVNLVIDGSESVQKQKQMLENELMRLESQLELSQKVIIIIMIFQEVSKLCYTN